MNYLITFTTSKSNYSHLVDHIKKLGDWAEVTPSTFVVVSDENAGVITERIQLLLGPKETVAVFSVSKPWASHCDVIVDDFLESVLGQFEDWTPHDWNEITQSRE